MRISGNPIAHAETPHSGAAAKGGAGYGGAFESTIRTVEKHAGAKAQLAAKPVQDKDADGAGDADPKAQTGSQAKSGAAEGLQKAVGAIGDRPSQGDARDRGGEDAPRRRSDDDTSRDRDGDGSAAQDILGRLASAGFGTPAPRAIVATASASDAQALPGQGPARGSVQEAVAAAVQASLDAVDGASFADIMPAEMMLDERISVVSIARADAGAPATGTETAPRDKKVKLDVLHMETHFEPRSDAAVLVEGESAQPASLPLATDPLDAFSPPLAKAAAGDSVRSAPAGVGPRLSFDETLARLSSRTSIAADTHATSVADATSDETVAPPLRDAGATRSEASTLPARSASPQNAMPAAPSARAATAAGSGPAVLSKDAGAQIQSVSAPLSFSPPAKESVSPARSAAQPGRAAEALANRATDGDPVVADTAAGSSVAPTDRRVADAGVERPSAAPANGAARSSATAAAKAQAASNQAASVTDHAETSGSTSAGEFAAADTSAVSSANPTDRLVADAEPANGASRSSATVPAVALAASGQAASVTNPAPISAPVSAGDPAAADTSAVSSADPTGMLAADADAERPAVALANGAPRSSATVPAKAPAASSQAASAVDHIATPAPVSVDHPAAAGDRAAAVAASGDRAQAAGGEPIASPALGDAKAVPPPRSGSVQLEPRAFERSDPRGSMTASEPVSSEADLQPSDAATGRTAVSDENVGFAGGDESASVRSRPDGDDAQPDAPRPAAMPANADRPSPPTSATDLPATRMPTVAPAPHADASAPAPDASPAPAFDEPAVAAAGSDAAPADGAEPQPVRTGSATGDAPAAAPRSAAMPANGDGPASRHPVTDTPMAAQKVTADAQQPAAASVPAATDGSVEIADPAGEPAPVPAQSATVDAVSDAARSAALPAAEPSPSRTPATRSPMATQSLQAAGSPTVSAAPVLPHAEQAAQLSPKPAARDAAVLPPHDADGEGAATDLSADAVPVTPKRAAEASPTTVRGALPAMAASVADPSADRIVQTERSSMAAKQTELPEAADVADGTVFDDQTLAPSSNPRVAPTRTREVMSDRAFVPAASARPAADVDAEPASPLAAMTSQVAGRIVEALGASTVATPKANVPAGETYLRLTAGGAALKTLTIQLQPENLGRLDVSMRLVDGQLTIELAATEASTAKVLSEDREGLRKLLQHAGFTLDDAAITIVTRDQMAGQPLRADAAANASAQRQGDGAGSNGGSNGHSSDQSSGQGRDRQDGSRQPQRRQDGQASGPQRSGSNYL